MKAVLCALVVSLVAATLLSVSADAGPFAATVQDATAERADAASPPKGIRITMAGVPVDDQAKAERFYTEVLGFKVKTDIDMGGPRWLTVVSPAGVNGVELLLEPKGHPATRTYTAALKKDGIPWTTFETDDIDREYERLKAKGVEFLMPPTTMGDTTIARFDDTCGNIIQLHEQ